MSYKCLYCESRYAYRSGRHKHMQNCHLRAQNNSSQININSTKKMPIQTSSTTETITLSRKVTIKLKNTNQIENEMAYNSGIISSDVRTQFTEIEQSIEEPIEEIVEEPIEEIAEELIEEIVEEPIEEIVEELIEEIVEEPIEEIVEEPIEEIAKELIEEIVKEPIKEPIEEIVEKTIEKNIKENDSDNKTHQLLMTLIKQNEDLKHRLEKLENSGTSNITIILYK